MLVFSTANATANDDENAALSFTSASCPKDSHAVIFANMHDYLGEQLEVPRDRNAVVDEEFPQLPISPAAKGRAKENAIQINTIKMSLDHFYVELTQLKERVDKLEQPM